MNGFKMDCTDDDGRIRELIRRLDRLCTSRHPKHRVAQEIVAGVFPLLRFLAGTFFRFQIWLNGTNNPEGDTCFTESGS